MRRLTLAALLLALPGQALAQPRLVTASPAANSAASKPTRLALVFSENLLPAASGFELVMTAMPGMTSHQPMPIRGFATSVADKAITASLPRALPVGTYRLTWHAAGADQQRAEGSYSFTVR